MPIKSQTTTATLYLTALHTSSLRPHTLVPSDLHFLFDKISANQKHLFVLMLKYFSRSTCQSTNVIISTSSVILYVMVRLDPVAISFALEGNKGKSKRALSQSIEEVQNGFQHFYFANFVTHLYAAESPTAHLKKPLTIIDILTIFPQYVGNIVILITTELESEPASSSAIPALDFLQVTRLKRLLRIIHFIQGPTPETNDISTHILRISITIISVMFCFAGIFRPGVQV